MYCREEMFMRWLEGYFSVYHMIFFLPQKQCATTVHSMVALCIDGFVQDHGDYLQCIGNRVTAVSHWTIDVIYLMAVNKSDVTSLYKLFRNQV